MRRTRTQVAVAAALMADPDGRHYGYETCKATKVRPGVVYPILGRMLAAGWLVDGWEDIDPATAGRPPRRYYTITDEGRGMLRALLVTTEKG